MCVRPGVVRNDCPAGARPAEPASVHHGSTVHGGTHTHAPTPWQKTTGARPLTTGGGGGGANKRCCITAPPQPAPETPATPAWPRSDGGRGTRATPAGCTPRPPVTPAGGRGGGGSDGPPPTSTGMRGCTLARTARTHECRRPNAHSHASAAGRHAHAGVGGASGVSEGGGWGGGGRGKGAAHLTPRIGRGRHNGRATRARRHGAPRQPGSGVTATTPTPPGGGRGGWVRGGGQGGRAHGGRRRRLGRLPPLVVRVAEGVALGLQPGKQALAHQQQCSSLPRGGGCTGPAVTPATQEPHDK